MKHVIAGGVCVDRVLSVPQLTIGKKHVADDEWRITVGGGAANHAIATRALAPDRRILLFAHTGNDEAGQRIRRFLSDDRGIEMPLAPLEHLPTSESLIVSEADARGTIISVLGARTQKLPVDWIHAELADAGAFSLGGLALNAQIPALLAAARAACVPTYFTLGSAQIYGLKYADLEQLLEPTVDLIMCNQTEARQLTGASDIETQLTALRFGGRVRTSVVTCGKDGLSGMDNLGRRDRAAYSEPDRPVIDDTGAGDAAAAAVVDALLNGLSLEEALAAGARHGFEACTAFGLEDLGDRSVVASLQDAPLHAIPWREQLSGKISRVYSPHGVPWHRG